MGRYRQVLSEKKEKSYQARIWWALWLVCFCVIAYTMWMSYSIFGIAIILISVRLYFIYKEDHSVYNVDDYSDA